MLSLSPSRIDVILSGQQFTANSFLRVTGAPATGSWSVNTVITGSGFNVTCIPGLVSWNTVPGIDPSTNLVILVTRDNSNLAPYGTFNITISNSWGDPAIHLTGQVVASEVNYTPQPPYFNIPSFIRTFTIGSNFAGQLGQHTVEATPPVVQLSDNPQNQNIGEIVQVNVEQFTRINRALVQPNVHSDYSQIWAKSLESKEILFVIRVPDNYPDTKFIADYHAMFGIVDAIDKVYLQCAIFNPAPLLPQTYDQLINIFARPALSNSGQLAATEQGILVDQEINRFDNIHGYGKWLIFRLISNETFGLAHMTISQNTNNPWSPRVSHFITLENSNVSITQSLTRSTSYRIHTRIFDYAFAALDSTFAITVPGELVAQQPDFTASVINRLFGLHQAYATYVSLSKLLTQSGFTFQVSGATSNARIQGLDTNTLFNSAGGPLALVIAAADVIVDLNYVLEYSYDGITYYQALTANNANSSFVVRTHRLAKYYRIFNNGGYSNPFLPEVLISELGVWSYNDAKLDAILLPNTTGWAPGNSPAQMRVTSVDPNNAPTKADFWPELSVLLPNVDLLIQPIRYQFANPSLNIVYALVKFQKAGRQTIIGTRLLNGPPDLGPWEVPNVVYPQNIVSIAGPSSGAAGSFITLTGSVILAPGRIIADVFWNQVSGPLVSVITGGGTPVLMNRGAMAITIQLPDVTVTSPVTIQFNVVDNVGILSLAQITLNVCQPFSNPDMCVTPVYTDELPSPILCP